MRRRRRLPAYAGEGDCLGTASGVPPLLCRMTVTSWQGAGLIVGFIGGLLIFSPWSTASGLTSAADLECLAASISYTTSHIYIYIDRCPGAGRAHHSRGPCRDSADPRQRGAYPPAHAAIADGNPQRGRLILSSPRGLSCQWLDVIRG